MRFGSQKVDEILANRLGVEDTDRYGEAEA
jgi:hypothetical protein